MDVTDLTAEQLELLYAAADRQRRYLERLYARCVTAGFPAGDPLRASARRCLLAARELVLTLNDSRPKGLSRRVLRASQSWPGV